ncbi:hypothetical protein HDU96_002448 [Phlyctochytrium bullatum]|nr:hypothetical protein HDU96_002448 [Phlyctochytrium bullatum]
MLQTKRRPRKPQRRAASPIAETVVEEEVPTTSTPATVTVEEQEPSVVPSSLSVPGLLRSFGAALDDALVGVGEGAASESSPPPSYFLSNSSREDARAEPLKDPSAFSFGLGLSGWSNAFGNPKSAFSFGAQPGQQAFAFGARPGGASSAGDGGDSRDGAPGSWHGAQPQPVRSSPFGDFASLLGGLAGSPGTGDATVSDSARYEVEPPTSEKGFSFGFSFPPAPSFPPHPVPPHRTLVEPSAPAPYLSVAPPPPETDHGGGSYTHSRASTPYDGTPFCDQGLGAQSVLVYPPLLQRFRSVSMEPALLPSWSAAVRDDGNSDAGVDAPAVPSTTLAEPPQIAGLTVSPPLHPPASMTDSSRVAVSVAPALVKKASSRYGTFGKSRRRVASERPKPTPPSSLPWSDDPAPALSPPGATPGGENKGGAATPSSQVGSEVETGRKGRKGRKGWRRVLPSIFSKASARSRAPTNDAASVKTGSIFEWWRGRGSVASGGDSDGGSQSETDPVNSDVVRQSTVIGQTAMSSTAPGKTSKYGDAAPLQTWTRNTMASLDPPLAAFTASGRLLALGAAGLGLPRSRAPSAEVWETGMLTISNPDGTTTRLRAWTPTPKPPVNETLAEKDENEDMGSDNMEEVKSSDVTPRNSGASREDHRPKLTINTVPSFFPVRRLDSSSRFMLTPCELHLNPSSFSENLRSPGLLLKALFALSPSTSPTASVTSATSSRTGAGGLASPFSSLATLASSTTSLHNLSATSSGTPTFHPLAFRSRVLHDRTWTPAVLVALPPRSPWDGGEEERRAVAEVLKWDGFHALARANGVVAMLDFELADLTLVKASRLERMVLAEAKEWDDVLRNNHGEDERPSSAYTSSANVNRGKWKLGLLTSPSSSTRTLAPPPDDTWTPPRLPKRIAEGLPVPLHPSPTGSLAPSARALRLPLRNTLVRGRGVNCGATHPFPVQAELLGGDKITLAFGSRDLADLWEDGVVSVVGRANGFGRGGAAARRGGPGSPFGSQNSLASSRSYTGLSRQSLSASVSSGLSLRG